MFAKGIERAQRQEIGLDFRKTKMLPIIQS